MLVSTKNRSFSTQGLKKNILIYITIRTMEGIDFENSHDVHGVKDCQKVGTVHKDCACQDFHHRMEVFCVEMGSFWD